MGRRQVLQSVAWASMVISYSQDSSSLAQVFAKIFDGKHPCKLCKLVAEGKKTDRKQQAQLKVSKPDLMCANRAVAVLTPSATVHCRLTPALGILRSDPPPTPPPRVACLT
jgi:hypothetical protein